MATTTAPIILDSTGQDIADALTDVADAINAGTATANMLAYVENGSMATQPYAKGAYICWQSLLYTADTEINDGDTFYTTGMNKNLTAVGGGGGFNDFRADYYDSGILPGSSNWVDTAITESDLRKWHFVVLCTSIVVSGGTRNITSATIPVGAVLTGQIFEAPYSFDNTLTAVMRFNTSTRVLQYNTGNGAWSCRIILCK